MHSYSNPLLILLEGEVSAVGEDVMTVGVSETEKLEILIELVLATTETDKDEIIELGKTVEEKRIIWKICSQI